VETLISREQKPTLVSQHHREDRATARESGIGKEFQRVACHSANRLSYRREVGRMMLREVSLKSVAERCCGAYQ